MTAQRHILHDYTWTGAAAEIARREEAASNPLHGDMCRTACWEVLPSGGEVTIEYVTYRDRRGPHTCSDLQTALGSTALTMIGCGPMSPQPSGRRTIRRECSSTRSGCGRSLIHATSTSSRARAAMARVCCGATACETGACDFPGPKIWCARWRVVDNLTSRGTKIRDVP